jgi:alpha-mannosidase
VDKFITSALNLANKTKGAHQMWPCGSDFQYQNADHWFHNRPGPPGAFKRPSRLP